MKKVKRFSPWNAKKDKIDPWRLAVSGPFALGPFALIIKNDIGSL
jgi:hypothetical protein